MPARKKPGVIRPKTVKGAAQIRLYDRIANETLHGERDTFDALTLHEQDAVVDWMSDSIVVGEPDNALNATLWEIDFTHRPADIETFLMDEYYLGKQCSELHPKWVDDLKTIFAPGSTIYEWVLTGAIGTGKTTCSMAAMAYKLHYLSCLRDPASYYGLLPGSMIIFGVYSVTKRQVADTGYYKLRSYVDNSPYFQVQFPRSVQIDSQLDFERSTKKQLKVVPGSQELHALGLDLYSFSLDEVNFMREKEDKSRGKMVGQAYDLYNATHTRIRSRFIRPGGTIPGIMILMSSRNSQTSFLETHLKKVKDSTHTYVSDYSLWEVKEKTKFTLPMFRVEVGDRIAHSRILADGEEVRKGARIVEVPGEFLEPFKEDVDQNLRDIAGVATFNLSPLIRDRASIFECVDDRIPNPFTRQQITLDKDNDFKLTDAFSMKKVCRIERGYWVPKINPGHTRFGHIDIALTGDCAGIAMGHLAGMMQVDRVKPDGTKATEENPFIIIDFMMRITPPPGSEIDLSKIRSFFQYVKKFYPLLRITLDGYQCFTAYTKVPLLDGRELTMRELSEQYGRSDTFWVYSYDKVNKRIVPGRAKNARKMGRKQVCRVVLDNGYAEKCTLDHLWMLRDGEYAEARNLKKGDSLMPLYRRMSVKGADTLGGYEMVRRFGRGPKWQYTHRMAADAIYGRRGSQTVVHHKDFNKANNAPDNLAWMCPKKHLSLHQACVVPHFAREGYWTLERRKTQSDTMRAVMRNQPDVKARAVATLRASRHKIRQKTAYKIARARETALQRNVAGEDAPRRLKHIDAVLVVELAVACPDKTQRELGALLGVSQDVIAGRLNEAGVGCGRGWRDRIAAMLNNHKVVSVEVLDEWEDVYDIEVDDYHNFALASGVFVHNSRDTMQLFQKKPHRIESGLQSIDKTSEPYDSLRSAHFDRRIAMYHYEPYMDEVLDLERHLKPGGKAKVDHPTKATKGGKGSKDVSDCVAGVVFMLMNDDRANVMVPLKPDEVSGEDTKQAPERIRTVSSVERAVAETHKAESGRVRTRRVPLMAETRHGGAKVLDWDKLRNNVKV